MTGLVVVAHAGLAAELITAAEMIVGKIEGSAAVEIKPEDSVDQIRTALTKAIESVASENVTPSNMSLSFLKENEIEVLTGVNLPMLIKFASDRSKFGVAELAAQIRDTGREGVTVAGDYLKK